jgi:hypothetical protein
LPTLLTLRPPNAIAEWISYYSSVFVSVLLCGQSWTTQSPSNTSERERSILGRRSQIESKPSVLKSCRHCPLFKLNGRNSTQHQQSQIRKLQLNCNKKLNWARKASKLQRTFFNFVGPNLNRITTSVLKSCQQYPLSKLNGRNSAQHQRWTQIGKSQHDCDKELNWTQIAILLTPRHLW